MSFHNFAVRLVLAAALLLNADPAVAQDADRNGRLRVFLDCPSGGCDQNFLITSMPFALWTQDRLDADVHLLITRIGTGAGGSEYTIGLIGRRSFEGRVDTLVTFMPPNSTDDMNRRELTRAVQIGLLPFVVRTSGTDRFAVHYTPPSDSQSASALSDVVDSWNFWVFRARANGSGSAESRSSNYQVSGSFNASRVTEELKLSFNVYDEYRANFFKLSDGTDRNYILRSADLSSRIVRSVSEHWSVGTRLSGGMSEFRNQDVSAGLDVSAEYNVFPWREATSKQLIALIALGGRYYDYTERTIFERDSELRPVARAIMAGESRQQWGSIDGALRYTQYLHDPKRFNVSFDGRAQIRLTRGLSLEMRADAAKVNDQLYLPRGEATDDEVLTRQRSLATSFRFGGSVGLTFTFGSIYNTIVNPRLDDLGG